MHSCSSCLSLHALPPAAGYGGLRLSFSYINDPEGFTLSPALVMELLLKGEDPGRQLAVSGPRVQDQTSGFFSSPSEDLGDSSQGTSKVGKGG